MVDYLLMFLLWSEDRNKDTDKGKTQVIKRRKKQLNY